MIAPALISLALLGLSGLLIDSHRPAWREARESATLTERDWRYARSLYLRRMQASGMIGAIGAMIAVWPIVTDHPRPLVLLFYTTTLLAACVWIMLLALIDVWATRQYYRRLRSEQLSKQLQLALEMAAACESTDAEGLAQDAC
jgi:hypothetical protein